MQEDLVNDGPNRRAEKAGIMSGSKMADFAAKNQHIFVVESYYLNK